MRGRKGRLASSKQGEEAEKRGSRGDETNRAEQQDKARGAARHRLPRRWPIAVTTPTGVSQPHDPRQSRRRGISVRAPTGIPYIKEQQGKAQPQAAFDEPPPLASASGET